ncbi:hypothetical protein [Nocardiopsis sp. FR4]|uniref:hypothetical protein n=1 Tax=Nocardiopsis sp. FR4 TaxID=2605985 RepID=UPI001356D3E9|nr:hypothetical protein [Nocardiopsis sp. FR4]
MQVVQQTHLAPNPPLFNRAVDAVVGTVLTAALGTIFGTALVGILLDEYQRRFSGKLSEYDQFLQREGILATYESSQEPRIVAALENAIADARTEITGVGLGLSVLMNRILLMRIAERLTSERSLVVNVILGSPQNRGVMNRITEEREWHESQGLAYDSTWPEHFPKEIKTILSLHAGAKNQDRVRVVQIKSYPTVGVLKIDNRTFVFLYGSPNMRGGSQSVWLELDASQKEGHINTFIQRYLEFFANEADNVRDVVTSGEGSGSVQ